MTTYCVKPAKGRARFLACCAVAAITLGSGTALAQDVQPAEPVPPIAAPDADEETEAEAAQTTPAEPETAAEPQAAEIPEGTPTLPESVTATSPEADGSASAPAAAAEPPAPERQEQEAHLDFSDLEADLSDVSGSEPEIDIYGFTDFTYVHYLKNEVSSTRPTFSIGNFNLFLGSELGSNWRALGEVRFLYLPHGALDRDSGSNIDTTVLDYADHYRPMRWGGVEIERIWLEHTFHPLITVRAGQWLTPYGIWNVDHGSPVIISIGRPFIVGEELLPERQTGVEGYGSFFVDATKLGYHLTLSNGRGPKDTYADLDNNKAIGGRLFLENSSLLGKLSLGASTYLGRYTDRTTEVIVHSDGSVGFGNTLQTRYDELAVAADLKWEYEGLQVQSEAVVQEVAFDDAARATFPLDPTSSVPDYRRWGVYGSAGYRTDFFNAMPYVHAEYYSPAPDSLFVRGSVFGLWFGVNIRPIPAVVFKAQYTQAFFERGSTISYLMTQLAWSF